MKFIYMVFAVLCFSLTACSNDSDTSDQAVNEESNEAVSESETDSAQGGEGSGTFNTYIDAVNQAEETKEMVEETEADKQDVQNGI